MKVQQQRLVHVDLKGIRQRPYANSQPVTISVDSRSRSERACRRSRCARIDRRWHLAQPTPAMTAARSASELREAASTATSLAVMKLLSGVTKKGGHRCDLRRIGHALERSHRGEDFWALLA